MRYSSNWQSCGPPPHNEARNERPYAQLFWGVLLREPPLAPRTWEALVSWPIPGPFHQELNSPSALTWWRPWAHTWPSQRGAGVLVGSPARPSVPLPATASAGPASSKATRPPATRQAEVRATTRRAAHGGCGFHNGLGRTLWARISIPSLQDGSLGGAVRHSVNSTRRYFVPIQLFAAAT